MIPMIDKHRIKTILFDLGGVLIKLHGTPYKPEWLPDDSEATDVWSHWKASGAVKQFECGLIDTAQFARQFIDEVGLESEEDEFIEHFKCWPSRLFPGVTAMLEELAQDYQLAALSNSNALHWPLVMEGMELQTYIPNCISSHQIKVMKPDRKAFEAVLHQLNVQPESVLFLDDLQVSIDMAKSLGMQAVKVTGTRGGVETVRSLGMIR